MQTWQRDLGQAKGGSCFDTASGRVASNRATRGRVLCRTRIDWSAFLMKILSGSLLVKAQATMARRQEKTPLIWQAITADSASVCETMDGHRNVDQPCCLRMRRINGLLADCVWRAVAGGTWCEWL